MYLLTNALLVFIFRWTVVESSFVSKLSDGTKLPYIETCNSETKGKFATVKDEDGNDYILLCVQEGGKFRWEKQEGNNPDEQKVDLAQDSEYEKNADELKEKRDQFDKESDEYEDNCKAVFTSCLDALEKTSGKNGFYRIRTSTLKGYSDIYCRMTTLPGCSGGGWTLVMKINGKKETFHYSSAYWTNNKCYNPAGGLSGLDQKETKLPTYWSTSFKELCVGMKVGTNVKFVSITYPARSLHSLIADGKQRLTNLGRQKWKSLISGSSLQTNCNRDGFNVIGTANRHARARIGIIGNNQNVCSTTDSFLGFGALSSADRSYCGTTNIVNTCGNSAYCSPDNGNKEIQAMGYIFVR